MFKLIELFSKNEIIMAADNMYETHQCRAPEYLPKYIVNGTTLFAIEDLLNDNLPSKADGTMKEHCMIPVEHAQEVLECSFEFVKQVLDDMDRPLYSILGQLYLTATDVRACSAIIPESVQ